MPFTRHKPITISLAAMTLPKLPKSLDNEICRKILDDNIVELLSIMMRDYVKNQDNFEAFVVDLASELPKESYNEFRAWAYHTLELSYFRGHCLPLIYSIENKLIDVALSDIANQEIRMRTALILLTYNTHYTRKGTCVTLYFNHDEEKPKTFLGRLIAKLRK